MPAGKMVHVILDNYAAHKHPKVRAWLDRHEPFVERHPHFTIFPGESVEIMPVLPIPSA